MQVHIAPRMAPMDIMRIVLSSTLRPVMEIPRIKMRFKMTRHSPAANRRICALDKIMFISSIIFVSLTAGYGLYQSVLSVLSVSPVSPVLFVSVSVSSVLSSDSIGVIVGSV